MQPSGVQETTVFRTPFPGSCRIPPRPPIVKSRHTSVALEEPSPIIDSTMADPKRGGYIVGNAGLQQSCGLVERADLQQAEMAAGAV